MDKMVFYLINVYYVFRIGNYLSSSPPIENGLKQRDALSPLLFNFALEYAIRKVQGTEYEWHPSAIGLWG